MRESFLNALRNELNRRYCPETEEIVSYFDQMIKDREEAGEETGRIIASLGPVNKIADNFAREVRTSESLQDYAEETEEKETELRESFADVKKIEIACSTYRIVLRSAEDGLTRLNAIQGRRSRIKAKQSGKTLEISQENDYAGMFRNFFRNVKEIGETKERLVLELFVPKEGLDSLEIDTVSGDVELCGISARSIEIDSVTADLKIEDVSCRTLSVDEVNGDTVLDGVYCEKGCEIDTVNGDVESLFLDSRDTEINTVSGDVSLTLKGPQNDYRISADRLFKEDSFHGTGERHLEIDTVSGKVSYRFKEDRA